MGFVSPHSQWHAKESEKPGRFVRNGSEVVMGGGALMPVRARQTGSGRWGRNAGMAEDFTLYHQGDGELWKVLE